jgi:thiol-disulfide isomerase/thioredoxin
VLRPGKDTEQDELFEAKLMLRPLPLKLPNLAGPPQVGQAAPLISESLQPAGSRELPELAGRSYLLFYWATWCGPCKQAVPEVLAFAEARGIPVVAISDEDAETVGAFLKARAEPFFTDVAVDALRKSFIAHGVSGTPTIVLVDGEQTIRHRQVGYSAKDGLTIEGWSWPGRTERP